MSTENRQEQLRQRDTIPRAQELCSTRLRGSRSREYAGNRLITSFNEIPVWRRGRDSNPRYRCRHTRFPGVPIKPLSHLSAEIPDAIHYRPCRNTTRCKKRKRVAERAGFEPAVRCRTPLFESGALSHSATSPTAKYSNGTRVLIALEAPK